MRYKLHFATAALAVLAACLYRFPPSQYGFYPRCPFFVLTHLQCPGCGMTRALAALLHGQFAASWHYNPLAMLILALVVAYLVAGYLRAMREGEWGAPAVPTPVLTCVFLFIAVFGVARNLPGMVK